MEYTEKDIYTGKISDKRLSRIDESSTPHHLPDLIVVIRPGAYINLIGSFNTYIRFMSFVHG